MSSVRRGSLRSAGRCSVFSGTASPFSDRSAVFFDAGSTRSSTTSLVSSNDAQASGNGSSTCAGGLLLSPSGSSLSGLLGLSAANDMSGSRPATESVDTISGPGAVVIWFEVDTIAPQQGEERATTDHDVSAGDARDGVD